MKTLIFVLGLAVSTSLFAQTNRSTRPNILFAIADDWSYGHAGARIKTAVSVRVIIPIWNVSQSRAMHFLPNAKGQARLA